MPAEALACLAKVLRLTPDSFEEAIEVAVRVLRRGGIVAAPTDTLYGISTLISHSDKLYSLKRRPSNKPLGLFIAHPDDIGLYAHQTISRTLASQLLPGPVTLVFERKPTLPESFNPGIRSVGIRVPDSLLINQLCTMLQEPLAQTSANVSGSPLNPTSLDEFEDIVPEIDLVLDGGRISSGDGDSSATGSTIVDLTEIGRYRIIRDGCALKRTEELLRAAGLVPIDQP